MAIIKTVDIQVENRDAIKEIDALNARLAETEKQLDAVNKELDDAEKKGGDGFKKAAKGADTFSASIKRVGTALKAAGIGLVLAALAKMAQIFKDSPAGAKIITQALETVNQAFYSIAENMSFVGDALVAFFKRDFGLAAAFAKLAVDNITKAVTDSVKVGGELADMMDKLRIARNNNLAAIEKERQAIERSRKTAENTDAELRTRLEAFKEIEEASLRMVQIRQSEAQQEIDIINLRGTFTISEQERLAQLNADLIAATTERITILKDAQNQENALLDANQETAIETTSEGLDIEEPGKMALDSAILNADKRIQVEKEASDTRIRIAQEEENAKAVALDATSQALTNLSLIAGKETVAGKALAIAASLINVYQGITKAIAQGGFAGIAMGVSVGIAGFAAIKSIIDTPIPGESEGGGAGVSAPSVQAPSFNVVGASQSSSLEQTLLSQGVRVSQDTPIKSYVVASDVTTMQSLERQVEANAGV